MPTPSGSTPDDTLSGTAVSRLQVSPTDPRRTTSTLVEPGSYFRPESSVGDGGRPEMRVGAFQTSLCPSPDPVSGRTPQSRFVVRSDGRDSVTSCTPVLEVLPLSPPPSKSQSRNESSVGGDGVGVVRTKRGRFPGVHMSPPTVGPGTRLPPVPEVLCRLWVFRGALVSPPSPPLSAPTLPQSWWGRRECLPLLPCRTPR